MKKTIVCLTFLIIGLVVLIGFLFSQNTHKSPVEKYAKSLTIKSVMQISSSTFSNNGAIPSKYSCDGLGINPPLYFSDIPLLAKSLVLIATDPDVPMGTFVHWVVYNIPPNTDKILEGKEIIGATSGKNSGGREGFFAPCPPTGQHRYFFKFYALDAVLPLPPGMTKDEVLGSIKGHILEQAQLVGLYKRQ